MSGEENDAAQEVTETPVQPKNPFEPPSKAMRTRATWYTWIFRVCAWGALAVFTVGSIMKGNNLGSPQPWYIAAGAAIVAAIVFYVLAQGLTGRIGLKDRVNGMNYELRFRRFMREQPGVTEVALPMGFSVEDFYMVDGLFQWVRVESRDGRLVAYCVGDKAADLARLAGRQAMTDAKPPYSFAVWVFPIQPRTTSD
ncbi:MAG TPA: hypothetical protein VLF67_03765 [Candidatus Saccharimonas sp.]|nr:hypothetical protein [Candidatus Saccharimonas sp.]